jgi:predicted Zn-dependent protease
MRRDLLENVFNRVACTAGTAADLVIVDSSQQNAWTDGDKVYVTSALVDHLPEDHVAATVGHELGHVIARHIPNNKKATEELRKQLYGGARCTGLEGLFATAVIETSIALAFQGRGRRQELEADAIGDSLAQRAGYGDGKMAQALGSIAPHHQTATIFDSHPTTPQRVAKLSERAGRKLRVRVVRKTRS